MRLRKSTMDTLSQNIGHNYKEMKTKFQKNWKYNLVKKFVPLRYDVAVFNVFLFYFCILLVTVDLFLKYLCQSSFICMIHCWFHRYILWCQNFHDISYQREFVRIKIIHNFQIYPSTVAGIIAIILHLF